MSTFEALGPIVDEVAGECEIICDGGIRRGTHVLKALELLRAEIERDMGLIGCRNISEIGRKHIA